MASIPELRAELDRVRAMEADWRARGAPEPEGAGVRAHVAAAEGLMARAIDEGRVSGREALGENPWTDDAGEIEMPAENMRREIEMPAENMRRPAEPQRGQVVQAHANKVAHKRSQQKPPRPARSSKDVLNKETDARFWAQSGYKVGQKLDPKNPADAAMTKLWLDIFHKVEAEDATGHLVTTWDHPEVAKHLEDATVARQAAEQHIEQAAAAPDLWEQTRNAEAASVANNASQASAQKAAKYQPPTASPHVAQTAANDAHAAAKRPPPGVKVFPKDHPIHWRPSAQPAHPSFNTPNAPDSSTPAGPSTASDELALNNAGNAPGKIAEHHADDAREEGETPNNEGSGNRLPKFGNKSPAKKKGMSTGQIVLIALGGVAAAGGIGYAIYRGTQSSRGPSGTLRMRAPRMPRMPVGAP